MNKKIPKIRNPVPQNHVKTTYYTNGMIESKTPYEKGKKHGVESWWYEDGSKFANKIWRNDEEHGMETWWYKNAGKRKEVARTWSDGWYESGTKEYQIREHGVQTWWYKDGTKQSETIFAAGELHGIHTRWHENGRKESERYHLNLQEYAAVEWDEEGNVTEIDFLTPTTKTIVKPKKSTSKQNKISKFKRKNG